MIKLQDTYIQTETQFVLDVLKFELIQKGIDGFHIFKNTDIF